MPQTTERQQLEVVRVDPMEAGWEIRMAMKAHFKYRLYFQNSNANRTSIQLPLIEDVLLDAGAIEGQDFILVESPFDMATLWNQSRDDDEKMKYGNSVYLTDEGWKIAQDIIKAESHEDFRHTFEKVTILEERV